MVSPVARSRQAHRFSTKKKKKYRESENRTHHVDGREIKSVAEKSNPNAQYCLYRANQQKQIKLNRQQQTKHRETKVFIFKKKKKKKKSPIHNPKPNPITHHDHVATTHSCSSSPLSLTPHRRSKIADCSASAPMLPPALPQGISLFFSLTITEMKNEMKFL